MQTPASLRDDNCGMDNCGMTGLQGSTRTDYACVFAFAASPMVFNA